MAHDSTRDDGVHQGEKWPYPARIYMLRLLWRIAYYAVWKFCPKRSCLRPMLLRLFGANASLHVSMAASVWIEMPFDLTIGRWVALGPGVVLYNLGGLKIGNHTTISQNAYLCGGTHDYTNPVLPLIRKPIVIGQHVWIAAGAFIGPGVTIGDGAVIGARAVVMKDVAPWTIVAGNPAKYIKSRVMRNTPPEIEE